MGQARLDQASLLPTTQAIYLCLQRLVDSMQSESDIEPIKHQPMITTSTELWRRKDLDTFIEALHSIWAKAPNGGFKAAHFREVGEILLQQVPDSMPKTTDQLSNKYQEIKAHYMAIVEWKGRSGIGGVLDGNLKLAFKSDAKVYDDFLKSMRNGNRKTIFRNLRDTVWPYFDSMHDICKTSAARGKAAHRGTILGSDRPSSSKASSSQATAVITLSHTTSVAAASVAPSESNVPSLISDNSSNSAPLIPTVTEAPHDGRMLSPQALSAPGPSVPSSLSVPSATAVERCQSKKSGKSMSTGSKRRRDALDDGRNTRSASSLCSSFLSADFPDILPQPSKATNAASMITLAGAVATLGTSINHQTMTSDTHIATKVQGFINSQNYLSDLEKSFVGEYYAVNPTLASGLLSITPSVVKITLCRHAKTLTKDVQVEIEEDMN